MANNAATEEFIIGYFDAMLREDYDRLWNMFADDVVYRDEGVGETFHSVEDFKAFYMQYKDALDFKLYIETLVTTEDAYGIGWRMEGVHSADLPDLPATNKAYSARGATMGTLVDGKIKTNTDYWNREALFDQLSQ